MKNFLLITLFFTITYTSAQDWSEVYRHGSGSWLTSTACNFSLGFEQEKLSIIEIKKISFFIIKIFVSYITTRKNRNYCISLKFKNE